MFWNLSEVADGWGKAIVVRVVEVNASVTASGAVVKPCQASSKFHKTGALGGGRGGGLDI